jgi:hypothetical protein
VASKETKTSKRGGAGTIRDITLTIPETCEIITKRGIAKSQSIIMAAYDTGFFTKYGINTRKKLPLRIIWFIIPFVSF